MEVELAGITQGIATLNHMDPASLTPHNGFVGYDYDPISRKSPMWNTYPLDHPLTAYRNLIASCTPHTQWLTYTATESVFQVLSKHVGVKWNDIKTWNVNDLMSHNPDDVIHDWITTFMEHVEASGQTLALDYIRRRVYIDFTILDILARGRACRGETMVLSNCFDLASNNADTVRKFNERYSTTSSGEMCIDKLVRKDRGPLPTLQYVEHIVKRCVAPSTQIDVRVIPRCMYILARLIALFDQHDDQTFTFFTNRVPAFVMAEQVGMYQKLVCQLIPFIFLDLERRAPTATPIIVDDVTRRVYWCEYLNIGAYVETDIS